jgi:hypothetical protein
MLNALRRGRPHLGEAKRFFRTTFEKEDVGPDLTKAHSTANEIEALNAALEMHELRHRLTPASDRTPEHERLLKRKLTLLEGSVALRAAVEGAIKDLEDFDPEVMVPVLDLYVDQFQQAHPQAISDGPDDPVRAELREIALYEGLSAQQRTLGLLGGGPRSGSPPPGLQPSFANATDRTPSLTVQEYYREVFRAERSMKTRRGEVGISPSGLEKSMEGARDFTDIMGQLRIAAVTPAHVREFKSVLLRVPTNWRKRKANLGKPLRALVQEADALAGVTPRNAPETVNSTISGLSAIFNFAVQNDHLVTNPAAGIRADEATDKDADPPYEISDLVTLFASPWFAGCASDDNTRTPGNHLIRDHRFWAFLCMLYTGARVAEMGGIHAKQVHLIGDDGFFNFDWTSGPDARRLKNASSVRIVPIHPELIRLGFIDYVKDIQAAGHERLFPGWIPQRRVVDGDIVKNEYSAADFLKRFKTYLVWLKIKRPGLSVKSFRSTWETATLGTPLNERSLRRITGRSQGDSLNSYLAVQLSAWEQLKPIVAGVCYKGLDLSHLYPKTDLSAGE